MENCTLYQFENEDLTDLFTQNDDFWSVLFEWGFIKSLTVASGISTILSTPLVYNIIVYNFNKHYRLFHFVLLYSLE